MEIITEEPLKVISQLIIPITLVAIAGFIQLIFKIYLSLREKNKYIKLLKANFPSVEKFIDRIKGYKIHKYFFSYMLFLTGIPMGFLIELILGQVIANILDYVIDIDINYIGKLLDLRSDVVFLNCIALWYSFLNIGIFIILFISILWHKFLKSKKLLIPKNDEHGMVGFPSIFVYSSFWYFIGILFGLYLNIIFYLIPTLLKLSIIDYNLSFDRVRFDLTYIHLLHPEVHVIIFIIGFLISLVLIVSSYYFAKLFNENVITAITDFYKYDFPYVKIKTESGEIQGQLRDILDKYLVTLSDNNILKIVQWDKIETMEIIPKNKKEPYIFNDPFTKQ